LKPKATDKVRPGHKIEVQNQLDDAVKRKAFAECGPLQDKLEDLTVSKKTSYR
jgi:hypothetical protein